METWRRLAVSGELGKPRVLRDREIVFERGQPADRAYLLFEGAHEVVQGSESGQSAVLKVVTPLTIAGSVELLAGEPDYLETIRIAGDAVMYVLEADAFIAVVGKSPSALTESAADVAQCFCGAARYEPARLFENDVVLATLFSAYADVFGEPTPKGTRISLQRSQSDLAAATGIAERSVNRILAQWQKLKLVSKDAGRYTVHDLAALKRLAGPLDGSLVHRWVTPEHALFEKG
ncbi:MAG: Crp/Fnr family transcriptional regulator [Myxococcaceae bacterium]|nr:Crp/Fnr family transcriptional regulator [Myxococcaceae bacterium]